MNFGDLKAELKALINRKDFDLDRAGRYIKSGVSRLERTLRLPFMERLVSYTGAGDELVLPSDFLELVDIYTTEGRIEQTDMNNFVCVRNEGGVPRKFVKMAGVYVLRPAPSSTTEIWLHYYAALPELRTDEDVNQWTRAADRAVLYGAAELAADFFEDERLGRFSSKYEIEQAELERQAERDVWSGPITMGSAGPRMDF